MSQGFAEVNPSPILLLKSMDSNPRGSFISPRNPCPRVLKLNPPIFLNQSSQIATRQQL
jgi:hypothetical protein